MVKGKSDNRPSESSAEHPRPPEPAPPYYGLSVTSDGHGLRGLMLLRVSAHAEPQVEARTLLASRSLTDVLDELGKVAYRLYGLDEGGVIWKELSE